MCTYVCIVCVVCACMCVWVSVCVYVRMRVTLSHTHTHNIHTHTHTQHTHTHTTYTHTHTQHTHVRTYTQCALICREKCSSLQMAPGKNVFWRYCSMMAKVWRRLREGNEREEGIHVCSGSTSLSCLSLPPPSLSLPYPLSLPYR